MSETYPQSTFLGIDLSARQIAAGNTTIQTLGLTNITLRHQDIQRFSEGRGQFDYIIAHGFYSWVPAEVQDHLLALCKHHLSPNGIAYISYNTYPGWHMFGMIREMLRYHTRHISDPRERVDAAESFLGNLCEHIPDTYGAYRDFLRIYSEFLQRKMDQAGDQRYAFLLHDELAEINTPITFSDFIQHTTRHGLQYLTESCLPNVLPSNLSPDAAQYIHSVADNILAMEQYIDYFRGCSFRETLLCHQHVRLNRRLNPASIHTLHIASPARVGSSDAPGQTVSEHPQVEHFQGEKGGGFALDHPLSKAAFHVLIDHYPRSLDFATLVEQAWGRLQALSTPPSSDPTRDEHILIANLLKLFLCSTDIIHLRSTPLPLATHTAPMVQVRPLARVQAQQQDIVTNLLHNRVRLHEQQRHLIAYMDGTRDLAALEAIFAELSPLPDDSSQDQTTPAIMTLDDQLRWLERHALLMEPVNLPH
jgi:methyltransferase-like protein